MDYIGFFKRSIQESYEDMFGSSLSLEKESKSPGWISSKGVAVVVGITGEKKGRVLIDMFLETALELTKILIPDNPDEDLALFSVAEFCNVVSGGTVTLINNAFKGRGLRLAPPSIFSGTGFKLFSPKLDSHLLSYSTPFGTIDFHIGFEGE